MNERLGDTAKDDAIVMGTGHGGLVRHPMNPRRIYWKDRLSGHSPGSLVAQFGGYFDDRGGLFTMAEDAAGNEKELLLDRWWRATRPDGTYFGGKFLFRWSRCEYSETTDAQPYDILIRSFRGADGEPTTWYDAADLYKAWAVRQFWCRKTFLEKTDFLPAWTRDAPVVMGFGRSWFDRPEFLKRWLENWKVKSAGSPSSATSSRPCSWRCARSIPKRSSRSRRCTSSSTTSTPFAITGTAAIWVRNGRASGTTSITNTCRRSRAAASSIRAGTGSRSAADGTRALVFANATGYVQPIAYRWKGAWTRTAIQPREIRLVPVE